MKNKNNLKIQLGAAVLGVIATTALVAGVTYAQVGPGEKQGDCEFKSNKGIHMQENRDEVRTAILNNDYEAWLAAQNENSPMKDKITSDNFSKLSEMHNLMQAGDKEGAKLIREELQLEGEGFGFGKFQQREKRIGNNEAIQTALENNDFEAWVAAHPADCPMAESLTEENFSRMLEVHSLMEAGDRKGAQKLKKDIGFGEGEFRMEKGCSRK